MAGLGDRVSGGGYSPGVRVVVALGGNAMTAADGSARPEDQIAAVGCAANRIAELVRAGAQVLVTHGNGPQVGNLLVKNELAANVVPPVPLDWCGAQTQGTLGFLLLNALEYELGAGTKVVAIITRTLVSLDDPGFQQPTKPIGRYVPEAQARAMIVHGQRWEDRGPRGWRRVVASPQPVRILDAPTAATLLDAGYVVVAGGGGGVPTVRDEDGSLRGVEAVIDKDLAAATFGRSVRADRLIIATDVPNVVLDWGTPRETPVHKVSARELRRYAFASGSMGPKVDAACRFVESGGERAIITSLDRIADDSAGTIVTTDEES
jgi:carbamate kinase